MNDEEILETVLGRLDGVVARHGYWMARCPAHDDAKASLSVGRGTEQPVVLTCHAGCDTSAVLNAIGLSERDICLPGEEVPAGEWTPHGQATAVYSYTDEEGSLLFQVLRTPGKAFPQRVMDPRQKSGWRWRLGDTRRVLYHLPRLRTAIDEGRVVYVVEGEKDVHSVEFTGHTATCNPGGAGKWRDEYSEVLRDAAVVIVADADEPGRAHARQVGASLDGIAASWEIREAAEGKDVSDHLASGRGLDELVLTREGAPQADAELAPDLLAFVAEEDPPLRWAIPHLLERGDRLIWTGDEGLGKTTVTRQIGVCAAAGVQPFRPTVQYEPQTVLFIDCENRINRSRRKFRDLVGLCSRYRRLEPGRFRIVHRPDGINLLRPDQFAYVLERVTAYRPDLLIIGPLYKLHDIDANEERSAAAIVHTLEAAINVCGSALIVEAHSAHGDYKSRPLRPRGSSLLLAWPDFGLGIMPTDPGSPDARLRVKVGKWRGPREEDHWWPPELVRGSGTELPWTVPMKAAPPARGGLPDYGLADDDDLC